MDGPLPCVICGNAPEPVFPDNWGESPDEPPQPYGATIFIAYGQYGSTVFDPPVTDTMDNGTYLQLNICDRCLVRAGAQGQVLLVNRVRRVEHKYYPWTGGDTDGGKSG